MLYKVFVKVNGFEHIEWIEAGDAAEARDRAAAINAHGLKDAIIEIEKIEMVKARS